MLTGKRKRAECGDGRNAKRAKTNADAAANRIIRISERMFYDEFAPVKADMRDALADLGVCKAVIANICRSRKSIERVHKDLHHLCRPNEHGGCTQRGYSMTLLRMNAPLRCPGTTKRDGVVPCRLAKCAWRLEVSVAAPAGALLERACADDDFSIGRLPAEIVGHIVRMVAYHFADLRSLRAVSRGLRAIVDATLPSILIDCSFIAVDAGGRWHAEYDDLRLHTAPKTPTTFRGRPCSAAATALLESPARTISILSRARNWRVTIAARQWNDGWLLQFTNIMPPFATDERMVYVRDLARRIQSNAQLGEAVRFGTVYYYTAELYEMALASLAELEHHRQRVHDAASAAAPHYPSCSATVHYAQLMDRLKTMCAHCQPLPMNVAELVDHVIDLTAHGCTIVSQFLGTHGVPSCFLSYTPCVDNITATMTRQRHGVHLYNHMLAAHQHFTQITACKSLNDTQLRLHADGAIGVDAVLAAAQRTAAGRSVCSTLVALLATSRTPEQTRAIWDELRPALVAVGAPTR